MKVLFNLLIVALTVAAGWYSQPSIITNMEASKAKALADEQAIMVAAVEKVTGTASLDPATAPASSAAQLLAASLRKNSPTPPAGADLPNGKSGSPNAADMAADATPVVAVVDEFEAKYPLPIFKEITDITKEWSSIPSRAFPRPVKTLVPINLEGPTGKIALPAQTEVLAVGMTQGMLVLMKNRENPARSLVPLANTDLKTTLTTLYEKYKSYKIEQTMKQRERARALKAHANGATESELAAVGPKPTAESGGVITAMLNSLRAKEIKETTEDRITAWGDLNIETIKGETYWTGSIQCTVDNALFGPTPTELIALIRNDKVIKWLYSGSKEEVQ